MTELGHKAPTRAGQGRAGHSIGTSRRLWGLKQHSKTSVDSGKTAWRRQPWLVLVVLGQEET